MKLMDLQRKWLKEHATSVEQVQEAIGLEQFLNLLPMEKRAWVYEKKPKTCVEVGELADQYEQVRKQEPVTELQQKPRAKEVHLESTQGRAARLRRRQLVEQLERGYSRRGLGWKESSALAVRSLDTSRRTAQNRL